MDSGMSCALSGSATTVAEFASCEIITGEDIPPELTASALAMGVNGASFGYGFATRN